jgi:hypothetical protein
MTMIPWRAALGCVGFGHLREINKIWITWTGLGVEIPGNEEMR